PRRAYGPRRARTSRYGGGGGRGDARRPRGASRGLPRGTGHRCRCCIPRRPWRSGTARARRTRCRADRCGRGGGRARLLRLVGAFPWGVPRPPSPPTPSAAALRARPGNRGLDVGPIDGHRAAVDDLARRVERRRRDTELDRGPVSLPGVLQEPQETRRSSEPDEEYAGRVGIERAGVSDASLAVDLAGL